MAIERGGIMKRILYLMLMAAVIFSLAAGCTPQAEEPEGGDETAVPGQQISTEERRRMDLYIAVMEGAFREENGGDGFVAVKLDTLEGLSNEAKFEVLKELGHLSAKVYCEEDVMNDDTKFQFDDEGRTVRTLDGSLLWVNVHKYNANRAEITGVSWFGNLGAVFPRYEAIYRNGKWHLTLINMAVS
jgi:hypothetical protein